MAPPTDRLPPERAGLLERRRTRRPAASPVTAGAVDRDRPPHPRFHVLAMATGWRSAFGGLNTFNRELCCALADAGCRVVCAVPSVDPDELTHARSHGVHLFPVEGTVDRADLPRGFVPEIVVGHGRVTGAAAAAVAETYPTARRLHFVHVAPDEIDPHKDAGEAGRAARSQQRTAEEIAAAGGAHRVVAVGPTLHGRYRTEFHSLIRPPVLRFDPGFDTRLPEDSEPPPGTSWRILLFGRAEDAQLKGLDIAARAVALAAARRGPRSVTVEFWVRGAPAGTADALAAKLQAWAGDDALRIVVRTYTTDPAELQSDLRRASLVLMPSRAEGFGLAGLEAIISRVPVLVSRASGLGVMISPLLDEEARLRTVLPVHGPLSEIGDTWARAIESVLIDRSSAFLRARHLQARLAEQKTWAAGARTLLGHLLEPPGH